jgi:hypothetical protein
MATAGSRLRPAGFALAGLAVLVAVATGVAETRDDDHPAADLRVGWAESEDIPACVYNPDAGSVEARLTIDGDAGDDDEVTVTVTAYADENTSEPVGSSSRTVPVDGAVHRALVITIRVAKPPHVDEDGVAACRLSLDR